MSIFAHISQKNKQTMNRLKGFIYGLATSITFGLIPLFTLPLMQEGMSLDSILFYRFLFATVALAGMMKLHKETFHIEKAIFLFFFCWPVSIQLRRCSCFGDTTSWEQV